MHRSVFHLLAALLCITLSFPSQAQIENYEKPPISKLLDQVEDLHIDMIIKIDRNMSDKEVRQRIQTLTSYDPDIKIGYERNEKGEITKLMCTHIGRMCGSEDFGHLLVTMKEGAFYNCRVGDR
jgi:hypothetical protein